MSADVRVRTVYSSFECDKYIYIYTSIYSPFIRISLPGYSRRARTSSPVAHQHAPGTERFCVSQNPFAAAGDVRALRGSRRTRAYCLDSCCSLVCRRPCVLLLRTWRSPVYCRPLDFFLRPIAVILLPSDRPPSTPRWPVLMYISARKYMKTGVFSTVFKNVFEHFRLRLSATWSKGIWFWFLQDPISSVGGWILTSFSCRRDNKTVLSARAMFYMQKQHIQYRKYIMYLFGIP